jgi:hypothetical protein
MLAGNLNIFEGTFLKPTKQKFKATLFFQNVFEGMLVDQTIYPNLDDDQLV